MKNILRLTLLSAALTVSGSILAQESKKAEPAKTEPKGQNIAPAQSAGKEAQGPVKKNKPKQVESKGASKGAEAGAKDAPSTPSGMAVSENGVATPAKAKGQAAAAPAAVPAGTAAPAAPAEKAAPAIPK